MQERHSDRERYFDEQARTTEKYYIPYIRKCCPELPQEVLEVGCGEGGNLFSFAQLGCSVTGVDIAAGRIAEARKFFAERGAEGTFIASDIFKLTELEHKFSLILVHDVIEHIDDKAGFLKGLKRYLAPGGVVFIAFPAWQMPFGGHQQIAHSKVVSHFPFLHLLPSPLYKGVSAVAGTIGSSSTAAIASVVSGVAVSESISSVSVSKGSIFFFPPPQELISISRQTPIISFLIFYI